jgi:beta-lactam-binding protein with PASTA domain
MTATLPNVVGLTLGDADSFLHDLGYETSHQFAPSGTVEADVVIRQIPQHGTSLDPPALVRLIASGGPLDPPTNTGPEKTLPPPGLDDTFPAAEPPPRDDRAW